MHCAATALRAGNLAGEDRDQHRLACRILCLPAQQAASAAQGRARYGDRGDMGYSQE